jgi:hypothetical protein
LLFSDLTPIPWQAWHIPLFSASDTCWLEAPKAPGILIFPYWQDNFAVSYEFNTIPKEFKLLFLILENFRES